MGIQLDRTYAIAEGVEMSAATIEASHDQLENCAKSQVEYGLLVALAPHVTFEIQATASDAKTAGTKIWNHQWFLMLVSILSNHPVHFPIQADRPCREIGSAKIHIGNVHFGSSIFNEPLPLTSRQMKDAIGLYPAFSKLLGIKRFIHACIVAGNNHREPNRSVRIAAVWSGIEALLGFDYELGFRIALSVSRLLEAETEARAKRFDAVKALYDQRSKCVHGAGLSDEELVKCCEQSQMLLTELIRHFLQRGALLSSDEFVTLALA